MKLWFKSIFKAIGGGFFSVFLYLLSLSLKDIITFIIEGASCEGLIAVPIKILIQLLYSPTWDNWAFLFFSFGFSFVIIIQLKFLLNKNKGDIVRKTVLFSQILLLIITTVAINYEIRNERAIKEAYAEFCQAVKNGDHDLAYSFFSPEYRNEVGLSRFKNEILDSFSYTGGCGAKFYGTIWHRWDGVRLYPFAWTNTACSFFLGGPELIMVRNNGKWYLTGEHTWYLD